MTTKELLTLIKRYEFEKLDFKLVLALETESAKKEFARDVCAIVNARGGRGYIIFGVKDKTKEIVGVGSKRYTEEQIQQIVSNRLDPPAGIRVDDVLIDNKLIVVVTIFKSKERPHSVRQTGAYYVRRGSTTDLAKRHELMSMFSESGLLYYENISLKDTTFSDLSLPLLKQHKLITEDYPTERDLFFLEALQLISKNNENFYESTVLGMLLFGKNPEYYIPSHFITIDFKKQKVKIKGPISKMLIDFTSWVNKNLSDNYPLVYLYEGIYNALCHRDYTDNSAEIIVNIKGNSIEIINSGCIFDVGKRKGTRFLPETRRRNPFLYQRLLMLDLQNPYDNDFYSHSKTTDYEDININWINLYYKNMFKLILAFKG